jgi:hypothetical protein
MPFEAPTFEVTNRQDPAILVEALGDIVLASAPFKEEIVVVDIEEAGQQLRPAMAKPSKCYYETGKCDTPRICDIISRCPHKPT